MTVWLCAEWEALPGQPQLNASRGSGLAFDEAGFLQGDYHLVDGGRGDLEMASHVRFGRGPFEDPVISVDEGQILALELGEARPFCGRSFGKCLTHFRFICWDSSVPRR